MSLCFLSGFLLHHPPRHQSILQTNCHLSDSTHFLSPLDISRETQKPFYHGFQDTPRLGTTCFPQCDLLSILSPSSLGLLFPLTNKTTFLPMPKKAKLSAFALAASETQRCFSPSLQVTRTFRYPPWYSPFQRTSDSTPPFSCLPFL